MCIKVTFFGFLAFLKVFKILKKSAILAKVTIFGKLQVLCNMLKMALNFYKDKLFGFLAFLESFRNFEKIVNFG